jgi:hypothetical protein
VHTVLSLILSTISIFDIPSILLWNGLVVGIVGFYVVLLPLVLLSKLKKRYTIFRKGNPELRATLGYVIPGVFLAWGTSQELSRLPNAVFFDVNLSYNSFFASTILLYPILVIFLKPSHGQLVVEYVRRIVRSREVRLLVWVPIGIASGYLFAIGFIMIWNIFGFPEILEASIVIWASSITMGLLTFVSVMSAEERASVYHPQIQNFVSLLSKIGKTESTYLLSFSGKDPPTFPSYNAALTKEKIENIIPWTLFTLSMNTALLPPYLFRLFSQNPLETDEIAFILFLIVITGGILYNLVKDYYTHVRWRKMWTDLWEMVRLLSLDLQTVGIEYSFTMSEVSWPIELHDLKDDEKKRRIQKLIDERSLNDIIPSDSKMLKQLFVNAANYSVVRRIIEKPRKTLQRHEEDFGFIEKATSLLDDIHILQSSVSAGRIVLAFLLLKLGNMKSLTKEMLDDIRPLWEKELKDSSIQYDAEEYVEDLMETERSVLPSSIKRFASIYPIAVSIATIIVLILQSLNI